MMKRKLTSGLGPQEAELIATLGSSGLRVFTVSAAARLLNVSTLRVSQIIHRLIEKRKLLRIEKAKYLVIPPEAWKAGEYTEEGVVIASQLISPYYVSYWTALSFYGWTEQQSRTIFVASTKSKLPVEVQGITIRFVKLRSARFFGFEQHWVGDQKVLVAEREKAIVDCLDQPRYCGEIVEAAKGLWNGRKELSFSRMLDYSIRMDNGSILKRLGYLMDVLGIGNSRVRQEALKRVSPNVVQLDPGHGCSGEVNSDWQVQVNIGPSNLTEWISH
jgi:predicted transcriptional regulator of viral defense system